MTQLDMYNIHYYYSLQDRSDVSLQDISDFTFI